MYLKVYLSIYKSKRDPPCTPATVGDQRHQYVHQDHHLHQGIMITVIISYCHHNLKIIKRPGPVLGQELGAHGHSQP